ncbi:hypothetical protein [Roseicyclus sp.]|uniref:hypothetical protein n=1 Tax=Roseicyclus sp. TaxID=1914329 RepID=UPI003FA175EB
MDRIVNMIVGRVVRQLVNRGVDAGVERVFSGSGDAAGAEPTAEQRQRIGQTKRHAREAIRLARRIGRF